MQGRKLLHFEKSALIVILVQQDALFVIVPSFVLHLIVILLEGKVRDMRIIKFNIVIQCCCSIFLLLFVVIDILIVPYCISFKL